MKHRTADDDSFPVSTALCRRYGPLTGLYLSWKAFTKSEDTELCEKATGINVKEQTAIIEKLTTKRHETGRTIKPSNNGHHNTMQFSLIAKPRKPSVAKNSVRGLSEIHLRLAYEICYGAKTEDQQRLLSSGQRGKVASVLGKLQESGEDLRRLPDFQLWWNTSWKSRQRGTDVYQCPSPRHLLEDWTEAMNAVETSHLLRGQKKALQLDRSLPVSRLVTMHKKRK